MSDIWYDDISPEERKTLLEWIDQASYKEMLRKWRFAPIGHVLFTDKDLFAEFQKSMKEKEKGVDKVAISKEIGWG